METVKDKIERNKVLAELLLKENKRVFIKDMSDNFYFANILIIGDERISIECFAPEQRVGKHYLPWAIIVELNEYLEKGT